MMLRFLPIVILACSASAQVTFFSAALDGANEVPPVTTSASAVAVVRLEEPANSVRVFLHHYDLPTAPTAGHLHLGAAGANGGILIGLSAGPGTDTFTGTATLNATQIAALKTEGTYLNVHTAAHPGGEIRGQVVLARSTRFTAELDGAQEVPPVTTSATGRADAYLHEPDNRLVYWIETTGLTAITAAHLHLGAFGTAGGVIFPIAGTSGVYCGVSPRLSASVVAALFADGTYFNVHTSANPGGEIRGQVRLDAGSNYTAALDGSQEVPPVATSGTASASLQIDRNGVANLTVSFANLSSAPVSGHVHFAPIGSNGPIVVLLTLSGGKYVATFTPTAGQLAQLQAGDWYVNLHTATFPGGEIRGQLEPAVLPDTFGPSCAGSNGERPEIGATGFAPLGGGFDVELYGAAPTAGAFLALGFNRDAGALGPLPVPFQTLGLNAPCFLAIDSLAALLSFTDTNGCATRGLSFGYVPGLTGTTVVAQWLILDAAAPAGVVASNALSAALQ
ncbi:MAG: CHRD domain-containing protein [Planctomycetes bacterium]|nr:CHRD domain-containing protein [Planctomycetota bacterium]